MYTGTRLTTAIHRRLSRFFLREGGRLYTGYWLTDWLIDQLTVDVHRRLENKFDLYYYDGLARQDEELRLTVGEHAFLRVNRHSVTYMVLVGYIAVTG